jgi:hypothetical protein
LAATATATGKRPSLMTGKIISTNSHSEGGAIDMQQQPILTAEEVIELLEKEALPDVEDLRTIFEELVEETCLVSGVTVDTITLELLKHFVDFLQNKGIYVYFRYYHKFYYDHSRLYFTLLAGECARVYEEMCKLEEYIIDLINFVCENRDKLPPEIAAAEEKKLEDYQNRLCDEIIFPLEDAYADGDKEEIKALLEKAQKVKEEIHEGIKDIERSYVLATSL